MAAQAPKKRKQVEDEVLELAPFQKAVGLEMLSDEEDEGAAIGSDDGEVDEFPEIDTRSDSEEDESEGNIDSEEEDEEEESTASSDADSDLHIFPESKTIISGITGQPKRVYPEIEPDYDSDSSTEDAPNRVGNVPMHWYDDLPHVGYDMNGKQVLRPARGDELDKFLSTVEDPNSWTSAFDKNAQMDKPLTSEELDIIRRLQANEMPDAAYDPYEPTVEWFTGKGKEEVMPLSGAPEPKRRWVPSKWEKQKVMKIVRAIRQGRIVPSKPSSEKPKYYSIWSEAPSSHPPPLPAPKPRLPTHSESYNPPEEYLPTEAERAEWEANEPEDRDRDYLPQKYSSLRLVPAYDRFIKERFNRQLDLYLAPRIQRTKLNIDPNSLIPKLPNPNSLKPFPTYKSLTFAHDKGRVRCLNVSPDGAWVISGDEDGIVSLWEVNVGREVKRWKFEGKIGALEWCPRLDVSFFVVGTEEKIHFVIPPHLPPAVFSATHALLAPATLPPAPPTPSPIKWISSASSASVDSPVLTLHMPSSSGTLMPGIKWISCMDVHPSGDHLIVGGYDRKLCWFDLELSDKPYKILRYHTRAIRSLQFHPTYPLFASSSDDGAVQVFHSRVYNDLMTDPLIVPLKILRGHEVKDGLGVLQVKWCPRQPWLATAGADGTIAIWCS
ncbi:hypothetical protein HWV62_32600 [Athelia sp. TMB]|nr:hypothetical protein HWV62_32600 [Athelia sp. TMB]